MGKELISALQLLPGLSDLRLEACDALRPQQLTAVSSLRALSIKYSTRAFIVLAPPSLQSLECDWDVTEPLADLCQQETQSPPIARLHSVTRLMLSCGSCGDKADYLPINAALLRNLPVRELVLLNCRLSNHTQLSTLFVKGALTGLQKLHTEDDETGDVDFLSETIYPTDSTKASTEDQEARLHSIRHQTLPCYLKVLETVGNGIVHLPQLQQVSVYSAVWNFEVDVGLKEWSVRSGADDPLMGCKLVTPHWLRVWSKP